MKAQRREDGLYDLEIGEFLFTGLTFEEVLNYIQIYYEEDK